MWRERVQQALLDPLPNGLPPGWVMLLHGLGDTLMIAALAIVPGVLRMPQRVWINWPARLYVELIHGRPVLVQLFIINFIVFAGVQADK